MDITAGCCRISAYWTVFRSFPYFARELWKCRVFLKTASDSLLMMTAITAMLQNPYFRARCGRREWVLWKACIRVYAQEEGIPYAARLARIGWLRRSDLLGRRRHSMRRMTQQFFCWVKPGKGR